MFVALKDPKHKCIENLARLMFFYKTNSHYSDIKHLNINGPTEARHTGYAMVGFQLF